MSQVYQVRVYQVYMCQPFDLLFVYFYHKNQWNSTMFYLHATTMFVREYSSFYLEGADISYI